MSSPTFALSVERDRGFLSRLHDGQSERGITRRLTCFEARNPLCRMFHRQHMLLSPRPAFYFFLNRQSNAQHFAMTKALVNTRNVSCKNSLSRFTCLSQLQIDK